MCRKTLHLAAFGLLLAYLAGCASSISPRGTGDSVGQADTPYPAVFQAAKDVIRNHGFDLDRVDAARGVIRTRPRASAGWATPWLDHGSTLHDSWAGLMRHDERVVEVRFRPAGAEGEAQWVDRRQETGPWEVSVSVEVATRFEPDRRPDPTSIRLVGISPSDSEGVEPMPRSSPVGADHGLAQRLAQEIVAKAHNTPGPPE